MINDIKFVKANNQLTQLLNMIDLSICIPSNRKLTDSQGSIDSALNYISQRNNSEVCVSDNSEDILKLNKYSNIQSDRFNYRFNKGLKEAENWQNASLNSIGHYIGYLADDDYIHSIGKPQVYEYDSKIAGYRPNFIVWEENKGIIKTTNFSIIEQNAKARVEAYFNNCNGNNNTLYSFIKKNISLEITSLCQLHPIKSGYYDWAIVLAYVSSGVLIEDNSTIYIYDNRNWAGSQEKINQAVEGLFVKGGLDGRGQLFINLFLAIDSFVLIGRKSSPVDRVELFDASQFAMFAYLNAFLKLFEKNKNTYYEAEKKAIEKLATANTIKDLLMEILNVIAVYNEKLTDGYIQFYNGSIEKKWGEF